MVLVIPLTIIQVQQQQDLRQRADQGYLNLKLSRSSDSAIHQNDSFDVNVSLDNSGGEDISSVAFTLSSSDNSIKIVDFQPSFYTPVINTNTSSTLQFIGINETTSSMTNGNINLGTLKLQGQAIGKSDLGFSSIKITASGSKESLGAASQIGSYSIVAQTSSATTTPPTPTTIAAALIPIPCGGSDGKQFGVCNQGRCINEGDGHFFCVIPTPTSTPTPTPVPPTNTPVPPTRTPTPTPIPVDCTSQSSNDQKNVCSNDLGVCLLPNYSIVGYSTEPGHGSIYNTNCTTTEKQKKVCCFYNPPVTPTPVPPTSTPIAGAPTIVNLKNRGDANSDGHITIEDFNIWIREFKKIKTTLTSDFNNSGTITIVDFNIWKDGFKDPSLPH